MKNDLPARYVVPFSCFRLIVGKVSDLFAPRSKREGADGRAPAANLVAQEELGGRMGDDILCTLKSPHVCNVHAKSDHNCFGPSVTRVSIHRILMRYSSRMMTGVTPSEVQFQLHSNVSPRLAYRPPHCL